MNIRSPIAATLLALTWACASPSPEAPEPAPVPPVPAGSAAEATEAEGTAEPRMSVSERAHWFARLGWPAACERAFAVTRSGDDGGLAIHDLAEGGAIALVRCAPGAYQPTSVVMVFDHERPEATARLLTLPYYRSPYGRELVRARTTEITGELRWLADQQSLVLLALSRQTADCGIWTRYSLAGGKPRITRLAARLPCPEGAELPVDASGGEPPIGWRPVRAD